MCNVRVIIVKEDEIGIQEGSNCKRRNHLGDLRAEERTALKSTLKKQGLKMLTEF
jgi:hypothetical protein